MVKNEEALECFAAVMTIFHSKMIRNESRELLKRIKYKIIMRVENYSVRERNLNKTV